MPVDVWINIQTYSVTLDLYGHGRQILQSAALARIIFLVILTMQLTKFPNFFPSLFAIDTLRISQKPIFK